MHDTVPVTKGGLNTWKAVWASDTKASLVLLYFWQNGFWKLCYRDWCGKYISLCRRKSFFFFFKEVWLIMHSSSRALKLHGLIKVDAKQERNKKTSKMFTKKLKQMSSACSISQSLLSSVVNMFQMTFSWEKKKKSLQHCRMWGVTTSQA